MLNKYILMLCMYFKAYWVMYLFFKPNNILSYRISAEWIILSHLICMVKCWYTHLKWVFMAFMEQYFTSEIIKPSVCLSTISMFKVTYKIFLISYFEERCNIIEMLRFIHYLPLTLKRKVCLLWPVNKLVDLWRCIFRKSQVN